MSRRVSRPTPRGSKEVSPRRHVSPKTWDKDARRARRRTARARSRRPPSRSRRPRSRGSATGDVEEAECGGRASVECAPAGKSRVSGDFRSGTNFSSRPVSTFGAIRFSGAPAVRVAPVVRAGVARDVVRDAQAGPPPHRGGSRVRGVLHAPHRRRRPPEPHRDAGESSHGVRHTPRELDRDGRAAWRPSGGAGETGGQRGRERRRGRGGVPGGGGGVRPARHGGQPVRAPPTIRRAQEPAGRSVHRGARKQTQRRRVRPRHAIAGELVLALLGNARGFGGRAQRAQSRAAASPRGGGSRGPMRRRAPARRGRLAARAAARGGGRELRGRGGAGRGRGRGRG